MNKELIANTLIISSNAFKNGEAIPLRYTGRGEDISPSLNIKNISPKAKSMAVIMDDITHPLFFIFNHWIIFNIPVCSKIPENIPYGKTVSILDGAIQGIGYGKHCYKGPKPPYKGIHIYKFTVFTLDCMLELTSSARKKDLIVSMKGHLLQSATLEGTFQNIVKWGNEAIKEPL